MKVECNDCLHLNGKVCSKKSKNGYNNCNKYKAIPMDVLKKERNDLLISKKNPQRLKTLTEKIKLFEGY
jgi:hypothetical protein